MPSVPADTRACVGYLPGARGEAKGLRQRMAWMARDSWRTTMRRGWEDAAEKRFAVWVMHPYPPLDPQSR